MREAGYGVMACAVAVAGAATLAGCAAPAQEPSEPWDEPDDYTYEATITVFGPTAGTWRVTVRDRDVVDVEPLDATAEYEASRETWTGAELFPTLVEVVETYNLVVMGDPHVAVLEEDEDGAPVRVELDPDESTSDDEYLIEVSEVAVP
ncbi:DUF6174 domain-containing protein [Demequina silvatica]|uniref:DUF6174 domain-containing protein n=1 Tax=Demequina silvatica TaxID=1638988 RepID=UPI0007805A01|nr:DUF6174 domain-containing protein [Demequina silvatica]